MSASPRSVEVSARSVDEAVTQALQQLGLDEDQVEIQVIRQGSRGLLGLLSESAIVRVTEMARREEPKRSEPVEMQPPTAASGQPGEQAVLGAELLQGMLDRMGVKARVDVEPGRREVDGEEDLPTVLNIEGEDLGLLIGRRGETLRDLQFLTCLMVSRRTQHWPDLMVDVEHYRARREKALQELARRIADRVRASAQPMPLEPMPANERRIVHLALKDDPDVRTESFGEADDRKVVVMPRK